jgi:Trp operon repressor
MTILSDGKVGIGTRELAHQLDVYATTITRGSIIYKDSLVKSSDKRIFKKSKN